jgi:hypothetical protein
MDTWQETQVVPDLHLFVTFAMTVSGMQLNAAWVLTALGLVYGVHFSQ